MFNFNAYVVVVGVVAMVLWFIIGLARLTHAWRDSQNRTAGLRQKKADDAKALLQGVEEIAKLNTEIRETKQRVEMLETAHEARKKMLAATVPPPPPAVYVSSEFPASSRDKPWMATLRRTAQARPQRSDDPSERYVLVWAPDHTAAQGRAQQALSAHPGHTVEGVMRFS